MKMGNDNSRPQAEYLFQVTFRDLYPSQALALEALFTKMESLSQMGCSRAMTFFADGDGSFHPEIDMLTTVDSEAALTDEVRKAVEVEPNLFDPDALKPKFRDDLPDLSEQDADSDNPMTPSMDSEDLHQHSKKLIRQACHVRALELALREGKIDAEKAHHLAPRAPEDPVHQDEYPHEGYYDEASAQLTRGHLMDQ